jgi:hypothetical protein
MTASPRRTPPSAVARRRCLLLAAALGLGTVTRPAAETLPAPGGPALALSGRLELNGAMPFPDRGTGEGALGSRLEPVLRWGKGWELATALRTRLDYGRSGEDGPGRRCPDYNLVSLIEAWALGDSFLLEAAIDRLSLSYARPGIELSAGRQRINWALTDIWSPNDVFARISPLDPDYVERPGTDSLRLRWYPSPLSLLDLACSPASNWSDTAAAGLLRIAIENTDLQLGLGKAGFASRRGASAEDELFVLAGCSGRVLDLGARAEAAFFTAGLASPAELPSFAATVSADYLLPLAGIRLELEAHYTSRPFDPSRGDSMLTASGLSSDRYSIYAEASARPLPWVLARGAATWLVESRSAAIEASLSLSSEYDIDLSAYWSSTLAKADGGIRGSEGRIRMGLRASF